MDMERSKQRDLLSRVSLAFLGLLCCVLAILQYHWIGGISRAEQERLESGLQSTLNRFSRDFNAEIASACIALLPTSSLIDAMGRDEAYAARYAQWRDAGIHGKLFSHMALAVPQNGTIALRTFDLETRRFAPADWPEAWTGLRDRLLGRLKRGAPGPFAPEDTPLIELPRFGHQGKPGAGIPEQEWLILELSPGYVRTALIPELIQRHLAVGGRPEYETEIFVRAIPSTLIYQSAPDAKQRIGNPDASVTLFEISHPEISRRSAEGPARDRRRAPPIAAADSGRGRWQMLVRHQAGSLDAIVARARRRNLAVSAALLLLMLATVVTLSRLSRQAHQLAELQMNFVTSVSHELRTPLTVIRTAAFNLKGRLGSNPAQVERYGNLIQQESEKLTALVEQVLRFASSRAGRAMRERQPVAVENLIEEGLQSSRAAFEDHGCVVEKQVEPGLPRVLGDEMALKHAIQNLFDNAVKYGNDGNNWIGVSATRVADAAGAAVEIRVADRGPGIPRDEQKHIFDPFFRGRRAIQDQIHGTGLGLNLVKEIVEAHGGTVWVKSESMKGTEFIVRIPAAPPEPQDEFAHSSG